MAFGEKTRFLHALEIIGTLGQNRGKTLDRARCLRIVFNSGGEAMAASVQSERDLPPEVLGPVLRQALLLLASSLRAEVTLTRSTCLIRSPSA